MLKELLNERNETHGDFKKQSIIFAELLKQTKLTKLTNEQFHSVVMILNKISRISAGDSNFIDHWNDIVGYSILALKSGTQSKKKYWRLNLRQYFHRKELIMYLKSEYTSRLKKPETDEYWKALAENVIWDLEVKINQYDSLTEGIEKSRTILFGSYWVLDGDTIFVNYSEIEKYV